jgi:hypothetical protein
MHTNCDVVGLCDNILEFHESDLAPAFYLMPPVDEPRVFADHFDAVKRAVESTVTGTGTGAGT